ncbi:hypothetical protein [Burkholderia cepacia]|uniref:hypothetical protein n=1 Tax=Burkholderia cepacia TaxID=292 RepID=UPI001CF49BCB|nr:hypothetical protein [Burkholderia cepacia]MCA8031009.1 hypothetical protein [Burkholderia cepacia]
MAIGAARRRLPRPRTGRLPPAHFALYRAYLEGLDEATLHAHYGVPGPTRA